MSIYREVLFMVNLLKSIGLLERFLHFDDRADRSLDQMYRSSLCLRLLLLGVYENR